MNNKLHLYLDMDNTLALFSTKKNEKQIVLETMYEEGFFRNLQPIDDCIPALKFINDKLSDSVEIYIMSACIESPYCQKEKIEWLQEHLPFIKEENYIFSVVGENKTDYIITPPEESILVDDYNKNLIQWKEWGGIEVKKRNSDKKGYKYIVRNFWGLLGILMEIMGE